MAGGWTRTIAVGGALAALTVICCLGVGAEGPAANEKSAAAAEAFAPAREQATSPAERDFFEAKIRPLLVERCYECHSGTSRILQGGLRVDSREALRRGGDSGPAIVPGDPDASLLVQAVRYEGLEMPPDGRLSAAAVADLSEWIRRGAFDPREEAAATSANKDRPDPAQHWAFQPLAAPAPPQVKDTAWPKTQIDRFILARLEAAGIKPARDASPEALARRAWFDLVGLPPTPEELDAVLADEGPGRLERLVDRLLASPQFGERWGRHWLDVARFAESSGGGRSVLFENAWRYRDYVIAAFNADRPFDRFVHEQVAGDLITFETLEERRAGMVATGFLMLGPKNLDEQDKEMLRMDVVDEQLDTIGRAFLGLAIGCARCHDHKFDPIPARDYYALAGILQSTKSLLPGNVSGFVERPLPEAAEIERERMQLAAERKQLEVDAKRVESELAELKTKGRSLRLGRLAGTIVDDAEAEVVGDWQASTSAPHFVGERYLHDKQEGKGRKEVSFVARLPRPGMYEVRASYAAGTNRTKKAAYTIAHAQGSSTVRIDQTRQPAIDDLFEPLGRFEFADVEAKVVLSNAATEDHVIADAVQFVPVTEVTSEGDGAAAPADKAAADDSQPAVAEGEKLAAIDSRVAELTKEEARLRGALKKLEGRLPPAELAMAVEEETSPADCPILIRGNVHKRGEMVPRGFLTVQTKSPPAIDAKSSGRLELAHWLTSDECPLTARVIVNRVWKHLLGEGLVRSADSFGLTGDAPSHGELLDWLAVEFVRHDWSIKWLVREIMRSRVYQMASEANAAAEAIDPENRLRWRMARRPLEAEALRDAMLAIAGQLDLTAGGPAMREGTKSEFGYEFSGRRRSVYMPVLRSATFDIFETFDFADSNLVIGDRTQAVLPTQALYLLNSPAVIEQAQAAAKRLLARELADDDGRIERAYREVLGRRPTDAEKELVLKWLSAAEGGDAAARWASVYQALFASVDFRFLE